MPNLTQSIPNLINGISQQAPALRMPTQAQEQINGYSSVVGGLRKRPPAVFQRRGPGSRKAKSLLLTRPDVDYLLTIRDDDGTVRPYVSPLGGDLDTDPAVNAPDGLDYLQCDDPQNDLRTVTLGDTTIITNRTKVPAMLSNTQPALAESGIVHIETAYANSTYEIYIDGNIAAQHTTGTSGFSPKNIASQLFNDLVQGNTVTITSTKYTTGRRGGSVPVTTTTTTTADLVREDLDILQQGSTLFITSSSGTPFTLSVTGSDYKDSPYVWVQRKATSIDDLPPVAPEGYKVEIIGREDENTDNYWVEFTPADASQQLIEGSWQECPSPLVPLGFDPATMPHSLSPDPDNPGEYVFREIDWKTRTAGDLETIPEPSFIGKPIEEVFFHSNRLGFLSDVNVHLGVSGDVYNFWRSTATNLLDDDPIDIEVASSYGATLRNAVSFDSRLLVFSDKEQIMVEAEDIITPATVEANVVTAFNSQTAARPSMAGRHLYFPFSRGGFSGFREYYVPDGTGGFDASDVTAHVAKYLQGQVVLADTTTNEDLLACVCDGDPRTVYLYKYFWSGERKIQSSWSKMQFSGEVQSLTFVDSDLYLVLGPATAGDADESSLVKLRFSSEDPLDIYLDRRVSEDQVEVSYDAGTGLSTLTLPYSPDEDTIRFVTDEAGSLPEGRLVGIVSVDSANRQIVVRGDQRGESYKVGESFKFYYEFSTFFLRRDTPTGGVTAVTGGRLQLRRLRLVYDRSGQFVVCVYHPSKTRRDYPFSGRVLGSTNNILDAPSLETGEFPVPLAGRNIETRVAIVNDSHLPSNFTSVSWEAAFNRRSTS